MRRARGVGYCWPVAALVLLMPTLGCAQIAGEVAGELLGACLEVTARAACATMCDDDDDADADDTPGDEETPQLARAEPPPPEWHPAVANCEVKSEAAGVFVDCAGGTRAAFLPGTELGAPDTDAAQAPTRRGPLEIRTPGDVGRLAGTRAVDGNLVISSTTVVGLTAPELQSVGGDLVVTRAAALERLALPALASVGGTVIISDNPRLSQREAEQIVFRLTRHGFAGVVEIAGNATP